MMTLTNRQQEVLDTLAAHQGNAASAGRSLGIGRNTVRQMAFRARCKLDMAGKKDRSRKPPVPPEEHSKEAARKKPPVTLPRVPSLEKDPPS